MVPTAKPDNFAISEGVRDWARQKGVVLEGGEWLAALPGAMRAYVRSRIQQELAWFQGLPSAPRLLGFYQQLARASLGPNQFLLQLGWGTGWDGKTFGAHLKQDGAFMRTIVREFRLRHGKSPERDPFPKSRRVAVAFSQQPDGRKTLTPALPLGWALVTLEPVKNLPPDWLTLAAKTEASLLSTQPAPAPTPVRTEASVRTARPASASTPARPTAAQPAARQAGIKAGPPSPFKKEFSTLPKKGDQFNGVVIFTETNGDVYLEIPGLSADDLAMAYLPARDNPRLPKMTENQAVLCEVTGMEEEPNNKGHWLVRCRLM